MPYMLDGMWLYIITVTSNVRKTEITILSVINYFSRIYAKWSGFLWKWVTDLILLQFLQCAVLFWR